MIDKRHYSIAQLRRRAERIAQQKATDSSEIWKALSPERMQQKLHELHVHQIELELQNEELRRIQMELDTSRARYFDLYDLAPVGYCTIGDKGLVLEANLTAVNLLGLTRGELVQQPITRFITREDQDLYYHHRRQLFETGNSQAYEPRMQRKDSVSFWARLEATLARDTNGESFCRLVLSDITRQVESEKALREAEERFRTFFDNAPIGKSMTDVKGHWVYVNQSLATMLGYTVDELMKIPHADLIHPEDLPASRECHQSLLVGKKDTWSMEKRFLAKDGHWVWTEETTRLIRDLPGNVMRFLMLIQDISERKRSEDALYRSQEELRSLALRLTEVDEAERQRISRELHDTVGQNVALLGIHLSHWRLQLPQDLLDILAIRMDHALGLIQS
ncbi:MAG: PAS domain S-box protein, partial [Syntrophales bacterium LBB04]|nr:PAS domain S-box protein [Syntrophales bacterium LBB04]